MDTHCGSTISNIDSLEQFHLKLTHSPTYRTGMRCQVTIETSPGSHIYFKFVSLDLEQNSDCSFDYVQFFDGDSKYSQNIAGKDCVTSLGNHIICFYFQFLPF